ncbi:hypothetical protein [Flavobacterium urumqiense]|uniref:Uncharacterized protein n=1 Tax=Flavobacterium urumqiense TaxID=935224 RepID=A0A1H5Z5B9_9FLAO|nr:hypothetical protein [Flavobacterium urumqiense]SEG31531.1 hypothetical protein SAMN04488130_109112 [Flavobacterium urumqiense]
MESNNLIEHSYGTIVINGGNPLQGCPKDWDEAKLIEEKLNENKEEEEPQWKFDCGFKLDYDSSIIKISSRFYPPKTHYGETWDGTVSVYFMDKKIKEKKFDYPTLEELHKEVEDYVKKLINDIGTSIV